MKMRMKNLVVLAVVCVLAALAGRAFATTWSNQFTNAHGTNLWSDPLNWDLGYAPTGGTGIGGLAHLDFSNGACLIDSAAICRATAGPGHSSGVSNSNLDVISGGSLTVTTGNWNEALLIAYEGNGKLNMYGGSVAVQTVQSQLGGSDTSNGEINLWNNASFYTGGALFVNRYTNTGKARVNMYGGTMDLGWLNINGDGIVNMAGGVIKVRSSMDTDIANYILAGKIVAPTGYTVMHDYGVTNSGYETIWAAPIPEPATVAILSIGCLGLLRKRKSA
jgi:hypothetical protein